MSQTIAQHLEFLAKKMNKKQSVVVQELIEAKMKEFDTSKKIDAVHKMAGMFTGKIQEDIFDAI